MMYEFSSFSFCLEPIYRSMNMSHISGIASVNDPIPQNLSLKESINDTWIRIEMNRYIANVNYWLLIIECIMVFCGICGNSIALIVINRRSLRDTSSSVFITYLAIFDSSVLLVQITGLLVSRTVHHFFMHCFLTYLTDFVTFSSVWIMVIMTLERCIAVHSPFLAKRFCTVQRARYSMYILIFWSFLFFTITFPFVYTIDRRYRKCGVIPQYQKIIRIVKPTIFYFIPDAILLINLFIIYELYMARRQRAKKLMNPENAVHQIDAAAFNRKQQQLTIMLVTVSLSFYIFNTPAVLDYIGQLKPPKYHDIQQLKRRFLRANLTVIWLQMSSAVSCTRLMPTRISMMMFTILDQFHLLLLEWFQISSCMCRTIRGALRRIS